MCIHFITFYTCGHIWIPVAPPNPDPNPEAEENAGFGIYLCDEFSDCRRRWVPWQRDVQCDECFARRMERAARRIHSDGADDSNDDDDDDDDDEDEDETEHDHGHRWLTRNPNPNSFPRLDPFPDLNMEFLPTEVVQFMTSDAMWNQLEPVEGSSTREEEEEVYDEMREIRSTPTRFYPVGPSITERDRALWEISDAMWNQLLPGGSSTREEEEDLFEEWRETSDTLMGSDSAEPGGSETVTTRVEGEERASVPRRIRVSNSDGRDNFRVHPSPPRVTITATRGVTVEEMREWPIPPLDINDPNPTSEGEDSPPPDLRLSTWNPPHSPVRSQSDFDHDADADADADPSSDPFDAALATIDRLNQALEINEREVAEARREAANFINFNANADADANRSASTSGLTSGEETQRHVQDVIQRLEGNQRALGEYRTELERLEREMEEAAEE